jgi:hypothetical protein
MLTLTTLTFPPPGTKIGLSEFSTRETAALLTGSAVLAELVAGCGDCAEVESGSTKIMANMAATDMNEEFIVIRFDRFAIDAYRVLARKR